MSGSGYIIEIRRVGAGLQVSAVDPETGIEVSMVGDPAAGKTELSRLAARKLDYVLMKKRDGGMSGKKPDEETRAEKNGAGRTGAERTGASMDFKI